MVQKPDTNPLVEDILSLAAKLFRVLLPTIPREVLELDVTAPQLKIMLMLYMNNTPMRMSAIASDLGITLATATGLIDRLVERGMITRESLPDDRRVVLCLLSREGTDAISRIWQTARSRMGNILKKMHEDRLKALDDALDHMLETSEMHMSQKPVG
jgi:DNA-binding MarR family transcriptional regulator